MLVSNLGAFAEVGISWYLSFWASNETISDVPLRHFLGEMAGRVRITFGAVQFGFMTVVR